MKINWGTAIVLVFIGFISFILFFVIRMNTDKKYEHDLVTEDYYKQELAFQEEINAEKNAKALKSNITIKKVSEGLLIKFPEDINSEKLSGTISLYRPSNKKLDFEVPISLTTSEVIIPKNKLIEGKWKIKVNWENENTSYLFRESFTY
ncbi:FixH family protein [Aquimarina sp. MMG015]|uniref:FixH family protein n=1 Tax=unclassified Aquimarina TaxID=2627091 RepID=UPI000E502527|nr:MULTISPECIES: FixH family protein [unclassified Aquimarina]AXT58204.1 cytochrome C oxidase Cbb3 [Aquimarina sp. AD1]MBQ4804971.1 FixH family protein [Aquimarina sp. MMG015]RKN28069.1 cytochrome C oxidase Cbb3 [Aquimarina sp. AD1]